MYRRIPGIFEERRGFCKFLAVLKVKVNVSINLSFNQNNYLFQIQINLINISTRAYNFKIKRIPSSLNIFTQRNKRCYVCLPIPCNQPSLSKYHQTVTIMNHCCYCFDGLLKMKIENILLCLSVLAKFQNARGASRHPSLINNCPACGHIPRSYQSIKRFVISPLQLVCGHEIFWPGERGFLRRKLT